MANEVGRTSVMRASGKARAERDTQAQIAPDAPSEGSMAVVADVCAVVDAMVASVEESRERTRGK